MKGKTVLITGATSGIGKETAVELARMGATIVFTTRNEEKGKKTKEEIVKRSKNKKVEVFFCDLASLDSIREFSKDLQAKHKKLHVLINNAGVWDFKRRESKDGIENIFAVNVLAPFLLTNLFLDILKQSAPARIINIASGLHMGKINFKDIEFKKGFTGKKAYQQSKLALILLTRLLARKLQGTGVTVNAVHPGMVKTDLGRDSPVLFNFIFRLMGKKPEKGARTSIYLASSPKVKDITGEYFGDEKVKRSSKESYKMDAAEKLWQIVEKYVK